MIEIIDPSDRSEVIDVLGAAFAGHPMIPPDPSGRRSRLMVKSLLDGFAAAPDARWFGIKRDGRWACVAFVFADGYEPPWWKMPRMLFQLLRVVGLKKCRVFFRLMSEKHEGDDRRLELMLLGTRTEHQGQGLGRAMMRHVFDFASGQDYEAVTLEVAKHTPAFAFYQSEGYAVEKEIELPEMPLCFMKRVF